MSYSCTIRSALLLNTSNKLSICSDHLVYVFSPLSIINPIHTPWGSNVCVKFARKKFCYFDFKKVTEQSRENPVFYVQYAHARCHSVLRHAAEALDGADLSDAGLAPVVLDGLTDPAELGLMKLLLGWPRTVEGAAEAHEPHRIAFYLGEVAAGFHGLWNKGKEDTTLRFLVDNDPELTMARLALVRATQTVIASGLSVIGVEPVEELRA